MQAVVSQLIRGRPTNHGQERSVAPTPRDDPSDLAETAAAVSGSPTLPVNHESRSSHGTMRQTLKYI